MVSSGLVAYLQRHRITHVIDATHPFAAQMSHNAVAACAQLGVPLIALSRAPWVPQPGDDWTHVADIAGAVVAAEPQCCARNVGGGAHAFARICAQFAAFLLAAPC